MKFIKTSSTLVEMVTRGKKLLTIEIDNDLHAEFLTAVKILGTKSYSSLLHQHIVAKIREAKSFVPEDEFKSILEEQKILIDKRSKKKSLERKLKLADADIAAPEIPTLTVDEISALRKKKK